MLLPVHDRKTSALGICMFTASKPHVLALQRASFELVRLVGGRALPGRTQEWTAPFEPDTWSALLEGWVASVGRFDAMAVYQRRQAERDGLTILLTRAGTGLAVVKVRSAGEGLQREQDALAAIASVKPGSFSAPAPLGAGSMASDLHWSAQTSVFDRPHRPVFEAPRLLFDEVRDCLAQVPGAEPGAELAHNDLTPWNLRRDHRGMVWLYDWEDWGAAPAQSDRVYFHATAAALTRRAVPDDVPLAAIEHWCAVLQAREHGTAADIGLHRQIMLALYDARRRAA